MNPNGRIIPQGLDETIIMSVVETFYARARHDPVIGPIFNRVIAEMDWPRHLAVIADFWSSMLLGSGRYAGRPMPKHIGIADIEDAHFDRWLMLFRQTVEEFCDASVAALFVDRAERIAHSFRIGIAISRGEDSVKVGIVRARSSVAGLQPGNVSAGALPGTNAADR